MAQKKVIKEKKYPKKVANHSLLQLQQRIKEVTEKGQLQSKLGYHLTKKLLVLKGEK